MKFSQEQFDALKARLDGRKIVCPVCGCREQRPATKFTKLPVFIEKDGDENLCIPTIALSCKECGYIMQFRID